MLAFALVCVPAGASVGSGALPSTSVAGAASATQDIHDIRPPFHIPQEWLWWAGGAGCCALVGVAAAMWRWRRRRANASRASACQVALQRLQQARALLSPEHARVFSIAVSGAVRSYIEQSFSIEAGRRTTREFLRDCLVESSGPLARHTEQLGQFLGYCDLAKFAGWALSSSEMEDMLASGIAFVSATANPAVAEEGTNSIAGPGKHRVRTVVDSQARSGSDVGENGWNSSVNRTLSLRPKASAR